VGGIRDLAADLPASAVAKFEEFPRPESAGRTVRVTIETPPRVAEATMWESGEVDLVSGNLATGDIGPIEHMELATRLGARGLLQELAWAVGACWSPTKACACERSAPCRYR
jgi:hypothetical protein